MHDTIRGALAELFLFNDKRNQLFTINDGSGNKNITVKDLQELNWEDLTCLADMLGMSDLYLEDKHLEVDRDDRE